MELVLDFYEHSISGLASSKFAKEVGPALNGLVTMVINSPHYGSGGTFEGSSTGNQTSLYDQESGCLP